MGNSTENIVKQSKKPAPQSSNFSTDLVFKTKEERDDYLIKRYGKFSESITKSDIANPVYVKNDKDFIDAVKLCSKIHVLKPETNLEAIYHQAVKSNVLSQQELSNFKMRDHIDLISGSFMSVDLASSKLLGSPEMPMDISSYHHELCTATHYMIDKSYYDLSISLFDDNSTGSLYMRYSNNRCSLNTVSEYYFFNSKIDLGKAMHEFSVSGYFNPIHSNVSFSSPWFYNFKQKRIRRYTLEISDGVYKVWEYNVFKKRSSSRLLGFINEMDFRAASAAFVHLINEIKISSSSDFCNFEIYDYENLMKFCELTNFDDKDFPDLLCDGVMYYFSVEKDQLIERTDYLKEKFIQKKAKEKIKKKSELDKIAKESNLSDSELKQESVGFLQSLFMD